MSNPTILCVDDERNVLLTLRTQLMRYFPDHTIEIAESGAEALTLVEELLAEGVEIPLIIADQIMPGMKGDQVLIELHTRYPQILKVMLTGQARAEDVGNVVNRGNLYRFMAKPWNEMDLQLTVTEALRRYQQEQQLTQTQQALEQANRELAAANADLEQQVQERTQQLQHNEQQLQSFVEHTPVGVAMFDRQMNYLVASQRWLKDYHLEDQSIFGKCHYDVFPSLNDEWREVHRQGLNGAVVRNEKDSYFRPDGTQEWVRWEVRPWYDDADAIGGIIILGEIITDRIRTEIALQESEERYRLLSEISPVGIFRNNLQGQCIYANTKTLEITGLSLAENLGNEWGKNLHPDDRDWMYAAWSNFVAQTNLGHAAEYKVEHRYLYPEGSLRWALGQAVPERNAAGELVGFIGSVIDITERKQAEIALQSLVEGTASVTGADFFPVLTQQIAVALNVSHVLITGLVGDHLHSLAFYADEQTQDTMVYPMIHTPCEQAIRDGTYYCSSGIQARFPLAPDLARFETDSYLGIALQNSAGAAIGVLCIFSRTPIVNPQRAEVLLRIFGARVAAEIERLQAIEVIQQLNADLEQRVQQRTQELQKLAAVVENSTDLIGIASMTGESLYLNAAGQRLIGVTSTPLTGMPVTTFLSPEGLIRFEQEAMPVLMQQGYWCGESIFRHLQTGEDIIAEQTLFLIKDAQTNEPLWIAMISRDIRYRKRAEAALRDSEERFRATFEQAAVGIVQANLEGQFIRMNQKFCDIVGYSEADLSQKIFSDITYPDDLAADNANVRRLLSGAASTFVMEKRYIHQNGSIVWVNLSVSLVRNGAGEPQYFIGVVEDISDRKLAEQKLQSERLRLQLALEAANMGTWESDMETGYWSERTEAIFGYAPGTFPGDREAFLKLVYLDDQERVFQALAHSFATQTPYNIEYRINRLDGELRWVAVNGKVVQNAAGSPRIVGMALDITDRKQAEESIRFSQEQLQLALEGSGDGLWDWNIATGEAYLSPRWLGMLGYESNELPGHVDTWDQLLHPDDKPQVMEILKAHLQDNSILYQTEYRARAKTGEWRWISNYGKVVAHDGAGTPVRMVGLQRDITDRKQAEIALHESQRFLQTVIDTFPLVVFWKDRQSIYLGCNQKSAIACGLDSPADIIGKTDYDMPWAETEAEAYRADDRRVIESGQSKLGIIETQLRPDGSTIWIETNKLPLYNLNGEVIGILGTYQDITDRKQAEIILRQYARMVETSPDGISLVDRTYTYRLVNQTYLDRNDQLWEDIVNHSISDLFGEEVFQKVIKARFDQCLAGETIRYEEWFHFKKAGTRYISVTYAPYFEADGTISGVVVSSRDDTERQAAEASLRDSEERLRLALTAANQGLYDLNLQTGEAIVSPEYATMLGYDPAKFHETNAAWIKRLHPDDVERTAAVYRAYVAGEIPHYKLEFRQGTKNGDWKWILSIGKIVAWDELGQPLRMLGTHTDIGDRKIAEAALQAQQLRLQLALDAAKMGNWSCNVQTGQLIWSDRAQAIFGFVPGTFPGDRNTFIAMIAPEDHDRVMQAIADTLETGAPYQIEYRIRRLDGEIRWVAVWGIIPQNGSLDEQQLIGVITDISDRKQTELERDRLLQDLSQLNSDLEQANQQLANYSQTLEHRVEERTAELKTAQERIIAQEKLASLGTLTAGIAHELRNPLNFVKNYAEGSIELTQDLLELLQPIMPTQAIPTATQIASLIADLQENASTIHHHSQRAAQIISSMMQHARTDSEQTAPEPIPLHDLLNEAVKLAYHSKRAQDSHFNLTIQTNYAPDLDTVDGVPSTLMRAFINLIDNACDAMRLKQDQCPTDAPQTTPAYTPILVVTTRRLGEQVEIRIRDNGCGIDSSIQTKIFDPFFTTKPPGAGTGLGLSLTHDIIVQQHQGTLIIDSRLGEFTEIIITLPYRQNTLS